MNTDLWSFTECQRCRNKAEAEWSLAKTAAANSYGAVPADQYERNMKAAGWRNITNESMGEKYSIGLLDGNFIVKYEVACKVCGFSHTFSYAEKTR